MKLILVIRLLVDQTLYVLKGIMQEHVLVNLDISEILTSDVVLNALQTMIVKLTKLVPIINVLILVKEHAELMQYAWWHITILFAYVSTDTKETLWFHATRKGNVSIF